MGLIESGKTFELRIVGDVPPGMEPQMIAPSLMAAVSFSGSVLPFIKASLVDVHDEPHMKVIERIQRKLAAKKSGIGQA